MNKYNITVFCFGEGKKLIHKLELKDCPEEYLDDFIEEEKLDREIKNAFAAMPEHKNSFKDVMKTLVLIEKIEENRVA